MMKTRTAPRLQIEPLEDRAVPATFTIADGDVAGLLAAVATANTNGEEDTIDLAPGGTYSLTQTLAFTNNLADDGPTTVNGNGATLTRDSAAPAFRIIFVDEFAMLSLDRVTITNGSANGGGGGIYVFNRGARLTITNTTVSGNRATEGAPNTGLGGGIRVDSLASAVIVNSTISGNFAETDGGGICVDPLASVTVVNSTVSGNEAGIDGGGIWVGDGSTSVIRNSTVAFNSADRGEGGGIFVHGGGSATIHSTIVGNNFHGVTGSFADVAGSVLVVRSLIEDTFGTVLADGSFGNVLEADPLLEPLADNGGPTRTHALRAESAAINRGRNPQGLEFDQRGPGFARVVGGFADIGAFEATPPPAGSIGFGATAFGGTEGGGPVTITLLRTGGSAGSLTVDLNAVGAGVDFGGAPTTITFADGQTTASVQLAIVDDAQVEGPESFTLSLLGPSVGAPATATFEIADNDLAPPPATRPPTPVVDRRTVHYLPFLPSPRGMRLAVADVTNDGVADLLIARRGRGPAVVVDGATGQTTLTFIVGHNLGFGGGVYLNAVDADADGDADFFIGLSGVRL